jgi:hypothetical protein
MACGQLRFPTDDDEPEPEDAVAEALAAFGLKAEAPLDLDDEFHLWPENESVFWLWMAVQTQWDVSDGVRYKLDYQGVKVVADARGVRKKDWGGIFSRLQMMEQACLNEWARNRR